MWQITLMDSKLWIICTILLSFLITTISTSACLFGPYGNCKFVPVPHGKTPECAHRPGQTYCEEVQDYPKYLIKSLLDKWCYDFNTLFLSETPIDFNGNVVRNPHPTTHGHHIQPVYGPPNHVPPNVIGHYPEPIYIPKPAYVTNEIGNTYLPPSPHAVSNYSDHNQNYNQAGTVNNNVHSNNNNYYPQNYYPNTIPYIPYNNQQQLASLISRDFWARLIHQRVRRSPFKEKQPYKFIPKTESFKEYITHKAPRKIDYTRNSTDFQREKRQFMSTVNNVGAEEITSSTRVKRQFGGTEQLCNVDTAFVKPKTAMNTNGNWKYVVNLDDNPQYEQFVQRVECVSPRSQCSQLCSLPEGYRSVCEQRYVQKRLVSLAENGQTLESDRFWLPSCCECVIQRV
ncbi:protein spaetzle 5-like [Chrysoperla carnea]|uniref:protein spaetzle 5-like n=1 Tax=Chrysoperla carnea TaxID=189513 RepID=UPI001D088840|nr:protein spaetzle 5-like [Chrysoperla carnea]